MGRYESAALSLEEPREPKSKTRELLLGMKTEIDPDGDAASVSLEFSNITPFRCHVPLLQAASIMNELRYASVQMIEKQHLKLDHGASKVLELCEAAIRPSVIQVMVDPTTHDRLFLFQFDHQAPIAVRVSPLELPVMLAQLARAVAHSVN